MSKLVKYPATSNAMKICIVGPKCSGKTALSRTLGGAPWESGRKYTPTVGVRIQEVVKDKLTTLEVWDCSGDDKYERCRPAMANNVQGLILVYNASLPKQKLQLGKWYQDFVVANNLPAAACYIVGMHFSAGNAQPAGMEGNLGLLPHTVLSLKDPGIRSHLLKVIDTIMQSTQTASSQVTV